MIIVGNENNYLYRSSSRHQCTIIVLTDNVFFFNIKVISAASIPSCCSVEWSEL